MKSQAKGLGLAKDAAGAQALPERAPKHMSTATI